jgi:hypothetical protein
MKEQLNFLLPELNKKIESFYKPATTKKQSLGSIAKSLGEDIANLEKLKRDLNSILNPKEEEKPRSRIDINTTVNITVSEIQNFFRDKINPNKLLNLSYSALLGVKPKLLSFDPKFGAKMVGIDYTLSINIKEAEALKSAINGALLYDENISIKDYKSHLDNRANWLKQKLSPNKESGEENENTLLENELKGIQNLLAKLKELTPNNDNNPMKIKELVEKLRAKYKAEIQSLVNWKEEILNGLNK